MCNHLLGKQRRIYAAPVSHQGASHLAVQREELSQAPRTLLLFLDAFDTLLVQPPEHTVAQYEALQNRLWDLGESGSPGSSSSGSGGGGGDAGKQRSAAEEARDPVVFGAECNNNPVCLEGYPAADGPLRFLNSGTYMGRATAVATYLSRVAEELQAVRPCLPRRLALVAVASSFSPL